jgi:hypothetical protein
MLKLFLLRIKAKPRQKRHFLGKNLGFQKVILKKEVVCSRSLRTKFQILCPSFATKGWVFSAKVGLKTSILRKRDALD